jgi:hypothetical protein
LLKFLCSAYIQCTQNNCVFPKKGPIKKFLYYLCTRNYEKVLYSKFSRLCTFIISSLLRSIFVIFVKLSSLLRSTIILFVTYPLCSVDYYTFCYTILFAQIHSCTFCYLSSLLKTNLVLFVKLSSLVMSTLVTRH